MRPERHEQALGTFETCTRDAIGKPLLIQSRTPGGETLFLIRIMMSNDADLSGCRFVVLRADCLRHGFDQVVCSGKIGSCSLQEQQML